MTVNVQSLWSEKIKPETLSPWAILREQAKALTAQTKGVLVGQLNKIDLGEGKEGYALDIVVPALDNYRHRVLALKYDKGMFYPVIVEPEFLFRPRKGEIPLHYHPIQGEPK